MYIAAVASAAGAPGMHVLQCLLLPLTLQLLHCATTSQMHHPAPVATATSPVLRMAGGTDGDQVADTQHCTLHRLVGRHCCPPTWAAKHACPLVQQLRRLCSGERPAGAMRCASITLWCHQENRLCHTGVLYTQCPMACPDSCTHTTSTGPLVHPGAPGATAHTPVKQQSPCPADQRHPLPQLPRLAAAHNHCGRQALPSPTVTLHPNLTLLLRSLQPCFSAPCMSRTAAFPAAGSSPQVRSIARPLLSHSRLEPSCPAAPDPATAATGRSRTVPL